MAIMSAPRGANYIFIDMSLVLQVKLYTSSATAPAITIRPYSTGSFLDPAIHIIQLNLVYQPWVKVTAAPGTRTSENYYQIMYPASVYLFFKFDEIPVATNL